MERVVANHPSAEQLRAFAQGRVSPAELTTIEAHLADCPDCCADLESLPDDGLVSLIRVAERSSAAQRPGSDTAEIDVRPRDPDALPRVPGYELQGELGRGGMGVVYKARQIGLGRTVALKMLLAGTHADPTTLARFRSEAEAVGRLRHPNVVQVHDTGVCDGQPYFALEYVEDGTLAQHTRGIPQSPRSAATLVEVLARAVAAAHREGIIHRDLKPANILLCRRTRAESGAVEKGGLDLSAFEPKVSDFGLARSLEQTDGLTQTGMVVGTPSYMAPEQAAGLQRDIGPATDVYSLGAVLYELLTGRPPFQARTPLDTLDLVRNTEPIPPRQLVVRLPRDLETICLKCLEKDAHRRYPTANALADDLGRFLRNEPIAARPVGSLGRVCKWAVRHPTVAGLLALTVLTLLVGTGVSLFFALQADRRARDAVRLAEEKQDALKAADRRAAELLFREGLSQCESGAVTQGMFTLLDAWELAPKDDVEFLRVVRTNLAGWRWHLPTVRGVHDLQGYERFSLNLVGSEGEQFLAWTPKAAQVGDTWRALPVGPPLPLSRGEHIKDVLDEGRLLIEDPQKRLWLRRYDGQPLSEKPLPEWLTSFGEFRLIDDSRGEVVGALRDRTKESSTLLYRSLNDSQSEPLQVPYTPGQERRVLADREGRGVLAVFEPDPNGEMKLWDLTTGEMLPGIEPQLGGGDPWVSWNGRSLLSVSAYRPSAYTFPMSYMGSVRWWDPRTCKQTGRWQPQRRAWYSVLSGDAATLASWGIDLRLRLYDLGTGLQRGGDVPGRLAVGGYNPAFRLTPDGATLLTGDRKGTIWAWETRHLRLQASLAANSRLPPMPTRGLEDPSPALFSPDGRVAVLCSPPDQHRGQLIDAHSSLPLGEPLLHRHLFHPTFSPDSRWLVILTKNHVYGGTPVARLWETATGKLHGKPLVNPRYLHTAAFSPDGETLALGGPGATVLWDVPTGKPRAVLKEATAVCRLVFSADCQTLAVGCREGWPGVGTGFRLWNSRTGKPISNFIQTRDNVFWLAFADGGRTLFAFTSAGELCALDTNTGRMRNDPIQLPERPNAAVFSRDGSRLTMARFDGAVQQWDAATGKPIGSRMVPPQRAVSLHGSADDRTLATLCEDGSVRLWDCATCLPLGPPLLHRTNTSAVAFTPDCTTLLTLTESGRVHRWPLPRPVLDDRSQVLQWMQVASGMQRRDGELVMLAGNEWRRFQDDFARSTSEPDSTVRLNLEQQDWHETSAADAEELGNTTATLRHLDRLIAERPHDWSLFARKGRVFTEVEATKEAETVYERAETLNLEATRNWYRHRLAALADRNRPESISWYEQRLKRGTQR